MNCRVFEYEGEQYEVPPKAMLVEAVLKMVFSPKEKKSCDCKEYELPENLKRFYEGKQISHHVVVMVDVVKVYKRESKGDLLWDCLILERKKKKR